MEGFIKKMAFSLGVSLEVAETLYRAGYDTPKKLRTAKKADLVALPGIGPATAAKLKGK